MQDYRPSLPAYITIMTIVVLILAFIIWLTIKVDVWGLAFQFSLMA